MKFSSRTGCQPCAAEVGDRPLGRRGRSRRHRRVGSRARSPGQAGHERGDRRRQHDRDRAHTATQRATLATRHPHDPPRASPHRRRADTIRKHSPSCNRHTLCSPRRGRRACPGRDARPGGRRPCWSSMRTGLSSPGVGLSLGGSMRSARSLVKGNRLLRAVLFLGQNVYHASPLRRRAPERPRTRPRRTGTSCRRWSGSRTKRASFPNGSPTTWCSASSTAWSTTTTAATTSRRSCGPSSTAGSRPTCRGRPCRPPRGPTTTSCAASAPPAPGSPSWTRTSSSSNASRGPWPQSCGATIAGRRSPSARATSAARATRRSPGASSPNASTTPTPPTAST